MHVFFFLYSEAPLKHSEANASYIMAFEVISLSVRGFVSDHTWWTSFPKINQLALKILFFDAISLSLSASAAVLDCRACNFVRKNSLGVLRQFVHRQVDISHDSTYHTNLLSQPQYQRGISGRINRWLDQGLSKPTQALVHRGDVDFPIVGVRSNQFIICALRLRGCHHSSLMSIEM